MNELNKQIFQHADLAGFFIAPDGEIIRVPISHIQYIIEHPTRFCLTADFINNVYLKHNEPLGVEAKAREVIIKHVVCNGWIRLRGYLKTGWTVNLEKMNNESMSRIVRFFRQLPYCEADSNPVRLNCMTGDQWTTVCELVKQEQ